mmetsp:Transcript_121452/g.241913  ORF Transcript_121452/g.241913 Transcript_121452/m.241913 type:complete len:264 (-) Transcript_121452:674-1465(-)
MEECEGEETPDLATLECRAKKRCNAGPWQPAAREFLPTSQQEKAKEDRHVHGDNRAIIHNHAPVHEYPKDWWAIDAVWRPPRQAGAFHTLRESVDAELELLALLSTSPTHLTLRHPQLKLFMGALAAIAGCCCAGPWLGSTINGTGFCCPDGTLLRSVDHGAHARCTHRHLQRVSTLTATHTQDAERSTRHQPMACVEFPQCHVKLLLRWGCANQHLRDDRRVPSACHHDTTVPIFVTLWTAVWLCCLIRSNFNARHKTRSDK